MHKKSRSKKGPRHPPQSNVNKSPSVAAELTPSLVTEIEENKNEQRVPDPNPEPIPDIVNQENTAVETVGVTTPSKPKRHRGGRKKKQVAENKDLSIVSEAILDEISVINIPATSISLSVEQNVKNSEAITTKSVIKNEAEIKRVIAEKPFTEIIVNDDAKCEKKSNTQVSDLKIDECHKSSAMVKNITCTEEVKSVHTNIEVCEVTSATNIKSLHHEIITDNTKKDAQTTNVTADKQKEKVEEVLSDNSEENKLNQSSKDIKHEPKLKGQGKKSKKKYISNTEILDEISTIDIQNKKLINQATNTKLTSVSDSDFSHDNKTSQEVCTPDFVKPEMKVKVDNVPFMSQIDTPLVSDATKMSENTAFTSQVNITSVSDTIKTSDMIIVDSNPSHNILGQDDINVHIMKQGATLQSNISESTDKKLAFSSEVSKAIIKDISVTMVKDDSHETKDSQFNVIKTNTVNLDTSSTFTTKLSDNNVEKHKDDTAIKKKNKGQKNQTKTQKIENISLSDIAESIEKERTESTKEVDQSAPLSLLIASDSVPLSPDFIAGPTEVLVNTKIIDESRKSDNESKNVKTELLRNIEPSTCCDKLTDLKLSVKSKPPEPTNQENIKDNSKKMISLLGKEPLLMICDKRTSKVMQTSNTEHSTNIQTTQTNLLQCAKTESNIGMKAVGLISSSDLSDREIKVVSSKDQNENSSLAQSQDVGLQEIINPTTSSSKQCEESLANVCENLKEKSTSIQSANTGLTIAEEIAESIKEELKCQLAIISGSSCNMSEKQLLTEQNIKDIRDETEKNVVKNIESIMKTTEHQSTMESTHTKENVVCSSTTFATNTQQKVTLKPESDDSMDKNVHKGKGKSKKGAKKDKMDAHVSTNTQVTSSSTTTSTEKSAEKSTSDDASHTSDSKNDSQSSAKGKQQKDSNTSENDQSDNKVNQDTSDKEKDSSCNSGDNTNNAVAREIGYFCIEEERDSIVTFDNERKNSSDDFEHIQQATDGNMDVQNCSKDGQKKTSAIRSKNLLGHPNIPALSSKDDYKKEKNKLPETEEMENVHVNSLLIDKEDLPNTIAKEEPSNVKFISENSPINNFQQSLRLGEQKQNCKKYKKDTESDDSEDEFVYKYNFRNVFLASACHMCKLPLQKYRSNCEYCKLVSYCSDNHKDTDWLQHQPLCYAVTTIMQINGLKHLYSKASSLSGHEYRMLRMQMIVLCEKLLKRKLLPSEQETLLYPRVCLKQDCREWQSDKLADCANCGQVSYCKDDPDHLMPDHKNWCQSYKIYHKLVAYQLEKGKVEPKLPNRILPQGFVLPDNCKLLMEELYNKHIDMDDCHYATLSQLSTAPLTALYSYQLWKQKCDPKNSVLIADKLTIHIVGAEMQFEVDTLNKWEAFFMHFCPRLKELNLAFVGPELNTANLPLDLLSRIRLCKFCRQTSKDINIQFNDGILYHDFIKEPTFRRPDLVCAFNPGLHRTTGFAGQDTWPDTIRSIMDMAVPFCVTSYTKQELPRDLTRVLNCTNGNIKTYVAPRLNPYASLRPDRNFISDDEMPLIFKNYYFMVLTGQS